MITADSAKQAADEKNSVESEQEVINLAIEFQSESGKYSTMLYTVNPVEIVKYYEALGFTIERKERFDEGTGYAYEISWK